MQVRHRIPTIFSIYMVDVLCCALGCVVLLWQVYYNEAETQTAEARTQKEAAETVLRDLLKTTGEKESLSGKNKTLEEILAAVRKNLEEKDRQARAGDQHVALLTVKLDETEKGKREALREAEKQRQLAVVFRSDYEQAKRAEAILKASLDLTEKQKSELTGKLDVSEKQTAALAGKLDEALRDAEKQGKLALVYKSDYEQAKRAETILQASLDLTEKQKTELAGKLDLSEKQQNDIAGKLAETEKKRLDALEEAEKQGKLALVYKNDYDQAKRAEAVLKKELAGWQAKHDELAKKSGADSAEKTRTISDLTDKELAARLQLAVLEKELKDARIDLLAHTRTVKEKDLSLKDAETRYQAIRDRLTISAKDLDDYKAANAQLKSRFAGMTLTGSKVIFLVDMSGSMEMVDENTLEPDKWPIVCDTVGRVMASLPDLKQYQVIMFSDKLRYPLGSDGQWLDYKSGQDVKDLVKALRAIKPKEGTNMSLAFGEVFRYRAKGLDTVYFFSDGLPNMGDELPTDARQLEKLDERARNDICSKYIRRQLKTTWNRAEFGQPRVRINTVGFFFESPEVGAFLWALAREHEGSFVGMSRP